MSTSAPTTPTSAPSGDLVIETTGLRKVYRSGRRGVVAVDGLDLQVPAGGVHGFLGPNGSGKTTTIRMLLGLTRPSKGEMRLFGTPVPGRLHEVLNRVGAVVEGPSFVPQFSGRKNLALLGASIGVPRAKVDSVLADVWLSDRAKDPCDTYSLGMKQRLAIAAALLKSPDLLVLDEPTNGLDPAGIQGIRELIRNLGESGVTVLLSSHILAEVQQVCHSVSIIGEGSLLASGAVGDLLGQGIARTRVRVGDPAGARALPHHRRVRRDAEGRGPPRRGPRQPRADHPDARGAQRLRARDRRGPPDAGVVLPQAHRPSRRDPRGRARRGGAVRGLVRVELNRFRSRRAIVLLALAAVLVSVVLAVLTAYQTRPLTAADRADAAAQADLASRSSVLQSDLQECIKDPSAYLGTNATAAECSAALVSDVSSFYPRHAARPGVGPQRAPADPRHRIHAGAGADLPDDHRGLHVRRRRLGLGLPDRAAALRVTARARVAGQGARGRDRQRAGLAGVPRRLLGSTLAGRGLPRHRRVLHRGLRTSSGTSSVRCSCAWVRRWAGSRSP